MVEERRREDRRGEDGRGEEKRGDSSNISFYKQLKPKDLITLKILDAKLKDLTISKSTFKGYSFKTTFFIRITTK